MFLGPTDMLCKRLIGEYLSGSLLCHFGHFVHAAPLCGDDEQRFPLLAA